jgi:hypothetical protein
LKQNKEANEKKRHENTSITLESQEAGVTAPIVEFDLRNSNF